MALLLHAEIYSYFRSRLLLNRRDGLRGGQTIEQCVDGKDKQAVGKPEKDAERDPQNKSRPVRLEVGDSKDPDFFEFLHLYVLNNTYVVDDS